MNKLDKYFDLSISSEMLYGSNKKVNSGIHGVSLDDKGKHFATSYHIYLSKNGIVLAKPALRTYLLNKFPGSPDLVNEYKKHFPIEQQVEYVGDSYPIKKVSLEWIVEIFEKENNIVLSHEKDSTNRLNQQNIEKEILPLLIELSESNVFTLDNGSHKKLFDDVFELIKGNPDKYEILALTFFPLLFEKTCSFFYSNSNEFKLIIEEGTSYQKIESKQYNLTSYSFVNCLKYRAVKDKITNQKIESFQDHKKISEMKSFFDIYYFLKLRNNLVHNEYKEEDFSELINSSKKLLSLNLSLIKEFK